MGKAVANSKVFKIKIMEADTNQTQLAEEFEVSKQTFNGWVAGRVVPPLKTALRIADRLNCTVDDLWEYKEE